MPARNKQADGAYTVNAHVVLERARIIALGHQAVHTKQPSTQLSRTKRNCATHPFIRDLLFFFSFLVLPVEVSEEEEPFGVLAELDSLLLSVLLSALTSTFTLGDFSAAAAV